MKQGRGDWVEGVFPLQQSVARWRQRAHTSQIFLLFSSRNRSQHFLFEATQMKCQQRNTHANKNVGLLVVDPWEDPLTFF